MRFDELCARGCRHLRRMPRERRNARFCPKSTLRAIASMGFSSMTPVQQAVIPRFGARRRCGRGVHGLGENARICCACDRNGLSSEGKKRASMRGDEDAAQRAGERKSRALAAIIVSPTRELARQTFQVASMFVDEADLKAALVVGGKVSNDLEALRTSSVDIMIGTPGRINDVLNRCKGTGVSLRQVAVLVLDEADVLLSMGFEHVIGEILKYLPKQRRTGLFSATQTREVRALMRAGMRNPVSISVKVKAAPRADQEQSKTIGAASLSSFMPSSASMRSSVISCDFFGRIPKKKSSFFLRPARASTFTQRCWRNSRS